MRRTLLAAAVLAAVALGLLPSSADQPPHPHLLRAQGRRLIDGTGREVILRGIAVIKKEPPYLPDVTTADFLRIRSWGMNSIRLGVIWAGAEPTQGLYDETYLDKYADMVNEATEAGLYVIPDMHQDLWSAQFGGDGAPAWAATACPHVDYVSAGAPWAANYLSPAVMCAFTNFWTSTNLQDHYIGVWTRIAERLKGNPMVAGYDLMNEPSQGFFPPGVFESQYLYPSQARWLAAIRTEEGKKKHQHVGFLEAPNFKNVHLPSVPAFSPPPNTVYAPHLYGFWDEFSGEAAQLREPLARLNFSYSTQEAKLLNLPLWLGEFGMLHNAPASGEFARLVYDMLDAERASGAWWAYEPGTGYSPVERDGTPRPILKEIATAYPTAVPGLSGFDFDAATSVLTAAWSGESKAVFAAPAIHYPGGPVVDSDGTWTWDEATGELVVTGGSRLKLTPSTPPQLAPIT